MESASDQKVYDGEPLVNNSYKIPDFGYENDYEFTVEIVGSIVEVGETANTIASVTVKDPMACRRSCRKKPSWCAGSIGCLSKVWLSAGSHGR